MPALLRQWARVRPAIDPPTIMTLKGDLVAIIGMYWEDSLLVSRQAIKVGEEARMHLLVSNDMNLLKKMDVNIQNVVEIPSTQVVP